MEIKNFAELRSKVAESAILQEQLKADPQKFLEQLEDKPPIAQKGVFLTIVAIVGIVLITAIVLGGIIIFESKDINTAKVPEFLVSMGSTALGALVGLLAPTPKS